MVLDLANPNTQPNEQAQSRADEPTFFRTAESAVEHLASVHHCALEIVRDACAIDGFLTKQLTLTQAANLACMSEGEFVASLDRRGVRRSATGATELAERATGRPDVSVVLPVFNEHENLEELCERLISALAGAGADYELVFVDDGSTDASADVIRQLARRYGGITLIELSRNFGHQAAITAGMKHAAGQAIILMDSDLQDPPEVLPEMLDAWRQGTDVAFAVRRKRHEGTSKRAASFVFYRLLRFVANVDVPLDSGDFCLMDRKVVQHLNSLPERNRFLRGLRAWVGFTQAPVYYERHPRRAGVPKYRFRTLVKLALDGLLSFSTVPLRLAIYLGFLVCVGGVGYLAFAVISHFVNQRVPVGWTSTVALILLLGGTQLLVLGVLGEYVARIYDESKKRPSYIIKSFSPASPAAQ